MSRKAAVALGAAIAAFGWVKNSIAATIAGWTFESSSVAATGSNVGPLTAEVGSGSASGAHLSTSTVWSQPAGNGSLKSLSSNVWTGGDYYQFDVDATNMQNIMVDFDQTRSATGPHSFDIQYSTDGSTFTSFGTYTLAGTAWSTTSAATVPGNDFLFDFSTVTALNNDSSIFFRLKSNGTNSSGGTIATAGTSRIDNVYITGTSIPEPATVGLMSVAAAAAMTRRRSKK